MDGQSGSPSIQVQEQQVRAGTDSTSHACLLEIQLGGHPACCFAGA